RPPTPAQLPTHVGGFVGREQDLAELDATLTGDRDGSGIAVLTGTAGVGKTALAVHWAHRVRERFPDGQLYVDLRGYGPDRQLDPEQALAGFLRALGLDGASIPNELAERSARFRSMIAGRRMLVVLDNARTVDQVRPLLPGTDACVALVTSRDALTGLGAREGARRIALARLSSDEAGRLLAALVGDMGAGSPESTARLLDQCARLPLALRIAADLVRVRPSRGIDGLVNELADERDRLDLLDVADDPYSAVRVVFSWSCQQLSSGTLRMFRMCGLHPGASFDAYSLAALAGSRRRDALRAIDVLVRAHLVDELPEGRFQLHDLLRAYATELVEEAESEVDRSAALDRLLDYYIAAGSVAARLAGHRGTEVDVETTSDTPDLEAQDGLAWLDAERPNLIAVASTCRSDRAIALGRVLTSYLYLGAHLDDAVKLQTRTLEAARELGDKSAEADASRYLGVAEYARGQHHIAATLFEQARAGYAEVGDVRGQAASANTLGGTWWMAGKPRLAIQYFEQAVALFRESDDRQSLSSPLANLAYLHGRLGDHEPAFDYAREAMAVADESGDENRRAHALINLARLSERTGRLDDALAYGDQVLPLVRDGGVRSLKDEALMVLGAVHRRLGDDETAERLLEESIEHSRTVGKDSAMAEALNELALTRHAAGDSATAGRIHRGALDAATAAGVRHEEARAWDGLGDVQAALGDQDAARESWQRALAIYRDLDVPEAESTRGKLGQLD
ncbi:MAG TPA: tetratricopeptide repeat protein, partial [Nocardioidaceae bacterium]|nr:tetratricopeptide repeat protein [Nocardioidaceae bacterium]